MRRVTAVATLAAAAALAGCGDGDEPPAGETETELEITLDADGEGGEPARAGMAVISCPDPDAAEACAAVAELPDDPAAPVPPDTPCTEIYGGPDVVTVEGSIEGEPIDAELTRANGCEIERFERFTPLLRAVFEGYRPGEALAPPGG